VSLRVSLILHGVIILSENYRLSLCIRSFNVLTYPFRWPAMRAVEWRWEMKSH